MPCNHEWLTNEPFRVAIAAKIRRCDFLDTLLLLALEANEMLRHTRKLPWIVLIYPAMGSILGLLATREQSRSRAARHETQWHGSAIVCWARASRVYNRVPCSGIECWALESNAGLCKPEKNDGFIIRNRWESASFVNRWGWWRIGTLPLGGGGSVLGPYPWGPRASNTPKKCRTHQFVFSHPQKKQNTQNNCGYTISVFEKAKNTENLWIHHFGFVTKTFYSDRFDFTAIDLILQR